MISRCRGSIHSNHRDRPFLQLFRQECVVGIRKRPPGDFPRLIPGKMYVVQNPHQLRDRHEWVRVVKLDATRDQNDSRFPAYVRAIPELKHTGELAGTVKAICRRGGLGRDGIRRTAFAPGCDSAAMAGASERSIMN